MTKTLAQQIREDLQEQPAPDEVRELLRAWLAADADFNTWFLETTKGSVDDDALFGLLGGYGETQDIVERAWRAFASDGDVAALGAALADSRARMAALQRR